MYNFVNHPHPKYKERFVLPIGKHFVLAGIEEKNVDWVLSEFMTENN